MSKTKKKATSNRTVSAQYLAEFKYEADGIEEIIAEFPITVPKSFEQLEVEQAKQILLRVLATERGKITNIFLWTFTKDRTPDGIKINKGRLVMSSAIAQYSEFGKEAEAYVLPEDEEILKLIITCFLRAVSKPYPPIVPRSAIAKPKIKPVKQDTQPMTKQEMRDIVTAVKKRIQLSRIKREEKVDIYLGLVEGLALSTSFCDDDLYDLDVLLNEALRMHKKQTRQAPKTILAAK
jgi:hypothetical protein